MKFLENVGYLCSFQCDFPVVNIVSCDEKSLTKISLSQNVTNFGPQTA